MLSPNEAGSASTLSANESTVPHDQPAASRAQPTHDTDRDLGTKGVDAKIAALGLPFVAPEQLNYLSEDGLYNGTKPFHTRLPFLGDIRRTNITGQGYAGIPIHDLGGHEAKFTLDTSGFEYLHVPTLVRDWTQDAAETRYLPEMEAWLKGFFKAEQVHIYTYTVSPWRESFQTCML